jgi:hypothetical protein
VINAASPHERLQDNTFSTWYGSLLVAQSWPTDICIFD